MNRTLLLFLAVVLLGGLAYLATAESSPFRAEKESVAPDRAFAYAEVGNIQRIFIADRLGNQAELTRGNGGWVYNGEYPANENVMKNLLQAITQLEVQRLPAHNAIPNMVKNLASGGILVQLYDRAGEKLRGYYIGGGTDGETGTIAITEGSNNPYVVHLPMWTGNVRHRFNLRGDDWRSKVLFSVDPERVEAFSIEYPRQRNRSFRLEKLGTKYTVAPFYGEDQPVKEVPRGVVEGVLSRYENYYVSRYENQDAASIAEARDVLPFAIISIKEKNKETQTVKVYPRFPDPAHTSNWKTGELINFDGLTAYTAFLNDDKDWALLAVETTQPLLVGYDAF